MGKHDGLSVMIPARGRGFTSEELLTEQEEIICNI